MSGFDYLAEVERQQKLHIFWFWFDKVLKLAAVAALIVIAIKA